MLREYWVMRQKGSQEESNRGHVTQTLTETEWDQLPDYLFHSFCVPNVHHCLLLTLPLQKSIVASSDTKLSREGMELGWEKIRKSSQHWESKLLELSTSAGVMSSASHQDAKDRELPFERGVFGCIQWRKNSVFSLHKPPRIEIGIHGMATPPRRSEHRKNLVAKSQEEDLEQCVWDMQSSVHSERNYGLHLAH